MKLKTQHNNLLLWDHIFKVMTHLFAVKVLNDSSYRFTRFAILYKSDQMDYYENYYRLKIMLIIDDYNHNLTIYGIIKRINVKGAVRRLYPHYLVIRLNFRSRN